MCLRKNKMLKRSIVPAADSSPQVSGLPHPPVMGPQLGSTAPPRRLQPAHAHEAQVRSSCCVTDTNTTHYNTEKQAFVSWEKCWADFPPQTCIIRDWKTRALFKDKTMGGRREEGGGKGKGKGWVSSALKPMSPTPEGYGATMGAHVYPQEECLMADPQLFKPRPAPGVRPVRPVHPKRRVSTEAIKYGQSHALWRWV